MQIRFDPPQLQSARLSSTLCRIVQDAVGPHHQGEFRIRHFPHAGSIRLELIHHAARMTSIELPGNWLSADLTEEEMLAHLSPLLGGGAPSGASHP